MLIHIMRSLWTLNINEKASNSFCIVLFLANALCECQTQSTGTAVGGGTDADKGTNSLSSPNINVRPSLWDIDNATLLRKKPFLSQLFQKYGINGTMPIEGLEHLLSNLGLANIHLHDHTFESEKNNRNRTHVELHKSHLNHEHSHNDDLRESATEADEKNNSQSSNMHKGTDTDTPSKPRTRSKRTLPEKKCLGATDILKVYGLNENVIHPRDFLSICPAIVHQLDEQVCLPHAHNDGEEHHLHEHDERDHNETEKLIVRSPAQVWGFSILAVVIISLVGLLCVGIVPLLHKVAFNHLQQVLVALAVSSLTGDALLHLLPHAFSAGDKHEHVDAAAHSRTVWIALVALGGIYVFFLAERIMGMCTKHTKSKADKQKNAPEAKEFLFEGSANEARKKCAHSHSPQSCDDVMMVVHPSKDVRKMADNIHDEIHENCDREDHEHRTHLHVESHGHSHDNAVSGSVASVAWMVILGDGFHNFCDGIAIGVAFAASMSGGLSTSIAVFCHELPHELGDFAVLLRVGMSIKKALLYNLVSSVLCFVGMVLGVMMGNFSSAQPWVFSLTAGMFIYIALVDMLPEITGVDPQRGESQLYHLLLQNIGLLCGAGIMLVIALFEHKIHLGDLAI